MDPFTLALLGSTATSAIGGLLGSRASSQAAGLQSMAAMQSALIQAQQADAARQQQQQFFNVAKTGYDPYSQFGQESLNRYATLMGLRPGAGSGSLMQQPTLNQLQMDPGYAFREQQGAKALRQQMAAGGLGASGTALKSALQFGQNMASQEYGNAYERFMRNRANQMNMLQGGVSTGFGAAQGVGNLATGTGTNIANTMLGAGQAIGGGIENAAQARASGYMGGAGALSQALQSPAQNYMAYAMMDRFTNPNSSGGGAPQGYVRYNPGYWQGPPMPGQQ